jgi:hypothetical protein
MSEIGDFSTTDEQRWRLASWPGDILFHSRLYEHLNTLFAHPNLINFTGGSVKSSTTKVTVWLAIALLCALTPVQSQDLNATLSGVVTDSSGKPVPNTMVSVKNVSTGQSTQHQTDSVGEYSFTSLAPGEYEISTSAEGIGESVIRLTLNAGERHEATNLSLASATSRQSPAATRSNDLPNAPSSSKSEQTSEPSLSDLGFSPAETQANAREQALLDKRTHMLKIHQRMGLITTVPLLATLVTSINAGGKNTSSSSRDLHVALGAITGDLYGITAYYAIRAPRVSHAPKRGPIRVHEALAWIHGPGMILTPILGAMAFNQKNNGEKVHGIASAHGPVAIVTAGAFGAALLSVSLKF